MLYLMLRNGWPASFRRTTVAADGDKPAKILVFESGTPVEVSAKDYRALKPDIGVALVHAATTPDGHPLPTAARDQTFVTDEELVLIEEEEAEAEAAANANVDKLLAAHGGSQQADFSKSINGESTLSADGDKPADAEKGPAKAKRR